MSDIKQKQAEEFIKDFCVKVPYRDTDLYYWKGFLEEEMNLIPTPKTIMQWIGEAIDLAIEERDKEILKQLNNYYDEIKKEELGTHTDKTSDLIIVSTCIGIIKNLTNNKHYETNRKTTN